jgi:site-specific DNA recombinase
MPSTNGSFAAGTKRAILYARVSTQEQVEKGYSLAQQLEALRSYAAREGYEVLEEISDPGQSGASLERPGMDRVRDLVAAGGISVVLAQDRDRFAREPAYHYLLRREFEEHGTKISALNDRGDESPEGELTDGIIDQIAKFERAKTAERTRRGKLQKARKGKLLRGSHANYGFKYTATGDSYVVYEEEMSVVRRIFHDVSAGQTLYGIKLSLEREGVPAPKNGRYWSQSFLRSVVMEDVYKPHNRPEIEALVDEGLLAQEVASRLDRDKSYGIFWFNRTCTTRKRVSSTGLDGREYRWRHSVRKNPRDQWIAIPVPDAGVPRDVIDAAREMIRGNRQPSSTGRRFFELSGGIVHCGGCGRKMFSYTSVGKGRIYSYYRCSEVVRNGKNACVGGQFRINHRAEDLEQRVWQFVSSLMRDPNQLRSDLERMIELERQGLRGDPDQETGVWLEKLAEADRMRSGIRTWRLKG